MTSKWDQMKGTPLLQAQREGRLLSHSQCEDTRCMKLYEYRRVLKLETKPSRALLMGSCFDRLCETGGCINVANFIGEDKLSRGEIELVVSRYRAYLHHLDYENDRMQVLVWAEIQYLVNEPEHGCMRLGEFPLYLHGWVDTVKGKTLYPNNDPIFTPTLFIDQKFTLKPVNGSAKAHWKVQAQRYLWMAQQMGWDVRWEWHVVNAETDEIDIIKYKPRQSTLDKVPEDVLSCWEKIQSKAYYPEISRLCEWCDYQTKCDAERTRRLEI